MSLVPSRRALLPSSALPLVYFIAAHAGLATACVVLAAHPTLPGPYFFHPRMVALVHLVTLAWISGSILGSFYIVAPLALRLPMPVDWKDWVAAGSFLVGVSGMAAHFWIGEYDGMAWAAMLAIAAIGWVAGRALKGLPRAPVPWPVKLHVGLAFGNMLLAGALGAAIGFDRSRGYLHLSPLAAAFAHLHLAAIGWALMMVVGLAHRLIPMMLPAAMPEGRSPVISAVLIELGLVIVVCSLLRPSAWLTVGSVIILAGFASFVRILRRTLAHRLPRPPALPRRDWSTWQTHGALLWLVAAMGLGVALTLVPPGGRQIAMAWVYGVAGLVGFLAQIIVGMQGRLIPLYAYYRAMAAREGQPPDRAANELPSATFARAIFLSWSLGVPCLAWGLAAGQPGLIASAAFLLLAGTIGNAAYLVYLLLAARRPTLTPSDVLD